MIQTPLILHEATFDAAQIAALREKPVWKEVDIYASQLGELAEIRFPADAEARQAFLNANPPSDLAGVWAYYPWSGVLLHCVGEDALLELRTNRNKLLITADEQAQLAACTVAVAGMSVGSGIALSCVYSGFSGTIKLADFDTLETANLNRLRESLAAVGSSKLTLTTQRIYELNPFATIIPFENGIRDDTLEAFLQDPATTVVVDEIDDFKMKVQLRVSAKAYGVPLLMFTSLGDSVLVDVERYDLDPESELFNGLLPGLGEDIQQKGVIMTEDAKRYAVQLVGVEYVPTRALQSLTEIGSTLVGRPQLYSTIAVDGGLAAYVIRAIVLGKPLKSGRYLLRFSDIFNLSAEEVTDDAFRQESLSKLFGEQAPQSSPTQ